MAVFRGVHLATSVATVFSCLALLFCCYSVPKIVSEITSIWLELDNEMTDFRIQSNQLWSELMILAQTSSYIRARREAANFHIRQTGSNIPISELQLKAQSLATDQETHKTGIHTEEHSVDEGSVFEQQRTILSAETQEAFVDSFEHLAAGIPSTGSEGGPLFVRQPAIFAPAVQQPATVGQQAEHFVFPPIPLPATCDCDRNNRCPTGPPGPQGYPGEPGLDGDPGQVGKPGADAPDIELTGEGQKSCFHCPPGASGPPGLPGKIGRRGPRGSQGQPGMPGRNSRPGPPGIAGTTGHRGIPGKPGEQGEAGAPAKKPVGLPGAQGYPGEHGPIGDQGAPGRNATDGPVGPGGPPGASGPAGVPGSMGEAGPQGYEGEPGIDAHYCPCPRRQRPGPVPAIPDLLLPTPPVPPEGYEWRNAAELQPQHYQPSNQVDFAAPGILPLPPGANAEPLAQPAGQIPVATPGLGDSQLQPHAQQTQEALPQDVQPQHVQQPEPVFSVDFAPPGILPHPPGFPPP